MTSAICICCYGEHCHLARGNTGEFAKCSRPSLDYTIVMDQSPYEWRAGAGRAQPCDSRLCLLLPIYHSCHTIDGFSTPAGRNSSEFVEFKLCGFYLIDIQFLLMPWRGGGGPGILPGAGADSGFGECAIRKGRSPWVPGEGLRQCGHTGGSFACER
jgi:hypothetical protein